MIKGLTYAIVTTSNVPRARAFFTEQLGLSTEDDMGDVFSQFTTREGTLWAVVDSKMHAEMAKIPAGPGAPAHGVELFLLVEDVDRAHQLWQERGVEMVSAPHDEPFGRTFAFKDADGRVLHAYARA